MHYAGMVIATYRYDEDAFHGKRMTFPCDLKDCISAGADCQQRPRTFSVTPHGFGQRGITASLQESSLGSNPSACATPSPRTSAQRFALLITSTRPRHETSSLGIIDKTKTKTSERSGGPTHSHEQGATATDLTDLVQVRCGKRGRRHQRQGLGVGINPTPGMFMAQQQSTENIKFLSNYRETDLAIQRNTLREPNHA